jgi:hypothetical protein
VTLYRQIVTAEGFLHSYRQRIGKSITSSSIYLVEDNLQSKKKKKKKKIHIDRLKKLPYIRCT